MFLLESKPKFPVTHPNIISGVKDDVSRISLWTNMFDCDSCFKFDFKEDFLSRDVFSSF